MFKEIIGYLDNVTIVFACVIMVLTILNFIRDRRQLEKIKIVFLLEKREILVDENLTRKDCQRSEIQGVLRTKLKKEIKFYDIDFLKENKYFENIYQIQKAKEDKLIIKVSQSELEQFDTEVS
jgi:hypothetical protein